MVPPPETRVHCGSFPPLSPPFTTYVPDGGLGLRSNHVGVSVGRTGTSRVIGTQ